MLHFYYRFICVSVYVCDWAHARTCMRAYIFNEIFSNRQVCQDMKVFPIFQALTPSQPSACAGGLVAQKLMTSCSTVGFVFLCSAECWMECDPSG
jgi:hypothetical protein